MEQDVKDVILRSISALEKALSIVESDIEKSEISSVIAELKQQLQ